MVIWYSRGDEWRIFVHVAGIGRQVLKRVMAVVGNSQHAKHGMRSQDIEKWLGGSILHFAICDISSLIPSSDLNSVLQTRPEGFRFEQRKPVAKQAAGLGAALAARLHRREASGALELSARE